MNFNAILFSKEHLISPFKMNINNKEISILDKKIKTIVSSILLGILTAGIGGIILFYCLSAKYKFNKLQNTNFNFTNLQTTTPYNSELPNPANTKRKPLKEDQVSIPTKRPKIQQGLVPNRSIVQQNTNIPSPVNNIPTTSPSSMHHIYNPTPQDQDQEFINNFVADFLHPYITGQITKETDSNNRKPMIELLQEKMPGFELSKKSVVEEIALKAFFKNAVVGSYIFNQKYYSQNCHAIFSTSSLEFEKKFTILIDALKKALPREFPNNKISEKILREMALVALDEVNLEKKSVYDEIQLDNEKNANPNAKKEYKANCILKIKQLNGQLFVAN